MGERLLWVERKAGLSSDPSGMVSVTVTLDHHANRIWGKSERRQPRGGTNSSR